MWKKLVFVAFVGAAFALPVAQDDQSISAGGPPIAATPNKVPVSDAQVVPDAAPPVVPDAAPPVANPAVPMNVPTDKIGSVPTGSFNPPVPQASPEAQLLLAGKDAFKTAVGLPYQAVDAFKTFDKGVLDAGANLIPNIFGAQDLAHSLIDLKTKLFFTPFELLTGVPRNVADAVADAVIN